MLFQSRIYVRIRGEAYYLHHLRGEWPSGLNSFRQETEVKLGRVRSNSGWVTSEPRRPDLTTHLIVLRKGR